MITFAIFAGVYLALGVVLTRWLTVRAPGVRIRLNDLIVGAVSMPVIVAAMLVCIAASKLWVRLLLLLDYEPEERPDSAKADAASNH